MHSGASSPKIWVVMVVIQIITFAFLVAILIEIILRSAYASLFLKSTVILTYGTASRIFGLLASKLLVWLRHKRDKVMIAYSIAMIRSCSQFNLLYHICFEPADRAAWTGIRCGNGPPGSSPVY